jgi:hypothetical protein
MHRAATLLQVLLPYLSADMVFDNTRAYRELGEAPTPFCDYLGSLYRFVVDNRFRYPYQPWPELPLTLDGRITGTEA